MAPSGAPRRCAVYVVAKAPRPGQSKTRLCPPLGPAQAAHLAAAFLQDTIALVREAGVDLRLICRDEAERQALLPFVGDGTAAAAVHVQSGIGLGAALESAFEIGLSEGCDAVGVLGMDTPALPPRIVTESFEALASADVALGPSVDGGYYLLTARRLVPDLFRDMVWSTANVAAETRQRCAALGLRVHDLPQQDDVDDFAALLRLRDALDGTDGGGARRTRAALAELCSVLVAGSSGRNG